MVRSTEGGSDCAKRVPLPWVKSLEDVNEGILDGMKDGGKEWYIFGV